ncbi:MAG: hypothetical protein ACLSIL_10235 [Enterococcus casseliflavus]
MELRLSLSPYEPRQADFTGAGVICSVDHDAIVNLYHTSATIITRFQSSTRSERFQRVETTICQYRPFGVSSTDERCDIRRWSPICQSAFLATALRSLVLVLPNYFIKKYLRLIPPRFFSGKERNQLAMISLYAHARLALSLSSARLLLLRRCPMTHGG